MKEIGSTGFLLSLAALRLIKTPRDTLEEFSSVPRSFLFQGVPEGEKEEVKVMAQEAIAFAAPRTEEMTRAVVGVGAGLATGGAAGLMAKIAPQFGVVSPILTWGSLLVAPVLGLFGALFTRGMLSDACLGVAAGGAGALGYCVPALLPELGLARAPGGGGQLGPGRSVKQLPAGPQYAPQRAQAQVSVGLGYE